ncbi:hypothetical protein pEaSNUABM11_00148 [Erwinia phage pEa_SNUABM_11]|nr:hypothetical protein pEaSNUABM11_00148 [Erwinia phage pEa_SNUABM_11]
MNALQIWGVVVYTVFAAIVAWGLMTLAPRYRPGKPWPLIIFSVGVLAIMIYGGWLFGRYVLSGL